jgi:hypothetical protein
MEERVGERRRPFMQELLSPALSSLVPREEREKKFASLRKCRFMERRMINAFVRTRVKRSSNLIRDSIVFSIRRLE